MIWSFGAVSWRILLPRSLVRDSAAAELHTRRVLDVEFHGFVLEQPLRPARMTFSRLRAQLVEYRGGVAGVARCLRFNAASNTRSLWREPMPRAVVPETRHKLSSTNCLRTREIIDGLVAIIANRHNHFKLVDAGHSLQRSITIASRNPAE